MAHLVEMRQTIRIACLCSWLMLGPVAPATVALAQPPPPGEFVPVEDAPPGEQIPAIGLIASAYGFIWIALLGYVWSLGKRLQKVETELVDLESRRK